MQLFRSHKKKLDYRNWALRRNPHCYYPLDEAADNFTDISRNACITGQAGESFGAGRAQAGYNASDLCVLAGDTLAAGNADPIRVIYFADSNDDFESTKLVLPFTIECLIYPVTLSTSNNEGRIYGIQKGYNKGRLGIFTYGGNTTIQYGVRSSPNSALTQGNLSGEITNGHWYHVAQTAQLTQDGTQVKSEVIINGVVVLSYETTGGATTINDNGDNPLILCGQKLPAGTYSNLTDVKLTEFVIYKEVFSAATCLEHAKLAGVV